MGRTRKRRRGEGSIEKLPSGKFRAVLPGRVRTGRSKSFDREKDAVAWLKAQAGKAAIEGTVGGWIDRWEPVQKANTEPGTWRRDAEVIKAFVRPYLGGVALASVTASRVNAWLAELHAAGRSDDERHRAWVTLRKILRAHDTFSRDILARVKAPTVRRPEAAFLDPAQYRQLHQTAASWEETHPYLEALVRVWVECCCRPREALAIRRTDYAGGVVRIRQALCPRTGKPKPLKTERSARDVPLSSAARAAVEKWLARSPELGPLFPSFTGRYRHYGRFNETVWAKLSVAAGIPDHTPKSLRHAGASLLLASGGSLLAVARRMGHSSPQLILRVYGHVMTDDQRKLADLFEAM
jgi:integrase